MHHWPDCGCDATALTHLPMKRLLALLLALPFALRAQAIAGTVVRTDGTTPASGIVVQLLDAEGGGTVSRTVSSSRGTFFLSAPTTGGVRLEILRVGQRPFRSERYELTRSDTLRVRLVLPEQPITLAALNVREARRCTIRPDSGALVAQLFTQARTVLLGSTSARTEQQPVAAYATYRRIEDGDGRVRAPVAWRTHTDLTTRPFISLPADSLARVGYVATEGDSVVYRAPDAHVLASDAFLATHCLHVVEGTGARDGMIGIGFRPAARRGRIVDIAGTMWLHRADLSLDEVEYRYDPVPDDQRRSGIGGQVSFAQLPDSGWFVRAWSIRMPRLLVRRVAMGPIARGAALRLEALVNGVTEVGGDVLSVEVARTAWYMATTRLPMDTTSATEVDFTLVEQLAAAGCANSAPDRTGVLHGGVFDVDPDGTLPATPTGAADAIVTAEWKEQFRQVSRFGWTWKLMQQRTYADARGDWLVCHLPVGHALSVYADPRGDRVRDSDRLSVRLMESQPRLRVELRRR
jgi:hypothetical protein